MTSEEQSCSRNVWVQSLRDPKRREREGEGERGERERGGEREEEEEGRKEGGREAKGRKKEVEGCYIETKGI